MNNNDIQKGQSVDKMKKMPPQNLGGKDRTPGRPDESLEDGQDLKTRHASEDIIADDEADEEAACGSCDSKTKQ
ncbi:MAG: hypothetical protein PW788_00935 [Micavibrio sp.]|nr:hypothetical protein [Micavibrio sp.]